MRYLSPANDTIIPTGVFYSTILETEKKTEKIALVFHLPVQHWLSKALSSLFPVFSALNCLVARLQPSDSKIRVIKAGDCRSLLPLARARAHRHQYYSLTGLSAGGWPQLDPDHSALVKHLTNRQSCWYNIYISNYYVAVSKYYIFYFDNIKILRLSLWVLHQTSLSFSSQNVISCQLKTSQNVFKNVHSLRDWLPNQQVGLKSCVLS